MAVQSRQPEQQPADAWRDTVTLASGTLLSRVLGFARDLLFAALLGPGADAFLAAFRIPNVFRRLLAEGSLGTAYGTAVSSALNSQGPETAARLGQSLIFPLFVLSLAALAPLFLVAKPLVACLAPGLAAAALDRAAFLLRLCLPYLPLCLFSALAFAHAAAFGNFRPQALGPALWNGVILSAGLAALPLSAASSPPPAATSELLLCLGVVLGGTAQACMALRCLRAYHAMPRPAGPAALWQTLFSGTRTAWSFLRRFPCSVLGAAPHQLHILAGTVFASFLNAGGIASLYFAERLVELPIGLAGTAIGLAIIPRFNAEAGSGDHSRFSVILGNSIRRSAFLSLPAAAGLFALALPLSNALFGHGAFDASMAGATASALRGYCLAIPALCAARPLITAAHALGHADAPLKSACLSVIPLALCAAPGLMLWGPDTSGKAVTAISFGLSAGAWANAFLLLRFLRRRGVPDPVTPHLRSLALYCAAALTLMGLLLAVIALSGPPGTGLSLLLICLSVTLWFVLFSLAGNKDACGLAELLKGRGREKKKL